MELQAQEEKARLVFDLLRKVFGAILDCISESSYSGWSAEHGCVVHLAQRAEGYSLPEVSRDP